MKSLFILLKISRPHFWLYLAGPYIIGYAAGINEKNQLFDPFFFLHLFYFLIVANIYVYGINDLFDHDTDELNKKKGEKEHKLHVRETTALTVTLLFTFFISFIFLFLQPTIIDGLLLLLFIFLSGAYSATPFRFKAIPFLDFISNIHYALPGILAYHQVTGVFPPPQIIIAAFAWTGAMHLFSAIPDIVPDKRAQVITTAVLLGRKKSLILCFMLWMVSSYLLQVVFLSPIALLSFIYPLIPLIILIRKYNIDSIYWKFPYLNALFGFLLFILVFLRLMYV